MKITELITYLDQAQREFGDLEVVLEVLDDINDDFYHKPINDYDIDVQVKEDRSVVVIETF